LRVRAVRPRAKVRVRLVARPGAALVPPQICEAPIAVAAWPRLVAHLFLLRGGSHGQAPACRLRRAPPGCAFGWRFALAAAVPSRWLSTTSRSSGTAHGGRRWSTLRLPCGRGQPLTLIVVLQAVWRASEDGSFFASEPFGREPRSAFSLWRGLGQLSRNRNAAGRQSSWPRGRGWSSIYSLCASVRMVKHQPVASGVCRLGVPSGGRSRWPWPCLRGGSAQPVGQAGLPTAGAGGQPCGGRAAVGSPLP
jgi:hypothetical protein